MYIQTKFNQTMQGRKEQNLKLNTQAYKTQKSPQHHFPTWKTISYIYSTHVQLHTSTNNHLSQKNQAKIKDKHKEFRKSHII